MALPGIGEVLAERILSYRTEYGNFATVEGLLNVEGIGEKRIEEILDLDAKQIDFGDVKSIVNQVNTASIPDVLEMQEDLEDGIQKIIDDEDLDIFMLLITDIVNSNSEVLVLGSQASLVEVAYDVTLEDNHALLEGVVSRKKQVVPIMTETASKL